MNMIRLCLQWRAWTNYSLPRFFFLWTIWERLTRYPTFKITRNVQTGNLHGNKDQGSTVTDVFDVLKIKSNFDANLSKPIRYRPLTNNRIVLTYDSYNNRVSILNWRHENIIYDNANPIENSLKFVHIAIKYFITLNKCVRIVNIRGEFGINIVTNTFGSGTLEATRSKITT